MKILSLSDRIVNEIVSPDSASRFADVDLVLGCGDLPYYYLESVVDRLKKPLFYVRGNHASEIEYSHKGNRRGPWGATDLHRKVVHTNALLIAGFEGSLRYRPGPFQYSQGEMWRMVFALLPRLLWNRIKHGRALDILVTHAPPWGIHDQPDLPHQGFKAIRWLLKYVKPSYHFHGHIHRYSEESPVQTRYENTWVINSYAFRETELEGGPFADDSSKEKNRG
jgi:Icc-related predicted phosphoesterase